MSYLDVVNRGGANGDRSHWRRESRIEPYSFALPVSFPIIPTINIRSVRLYDEDVGNFLILNIDVAASTFSMNLTVHKWFYDAATDMRLYTGTWRTGWSGTHGHNSMLIMSKLSEMLDKFLTEYLCMNESACE